MRAMDGDALEIGRRFRLGEGSVGLDVLRRTNAEDRVDVGGDVFKLDIGHREGANIAAGAREGYPRCRMDLAALIDHLGTGVGGKGGKVPRLSVQ